MKSSIKAVLITSFAITDLAIDFLNYMFSLKLQHLPKIK